MNKQKTDELRDHYDTTDTSDQMDGGTWETDVDPNPMVTTSLRLPKDVLDWVREQAAEQHTKPTALIRQWIEQRQAISRRPHKLVTGGRPAELEERLQRLEQAVFEGSEDLVQAPRHPID
ncbi:MAG: hypothetical protein L0I76_08035 [Pseudonocardia sp.]|nr:hypothetical protein [Pseudonocardia sp.]